MRTLASTTPREPTKDAFRFLGSKDAIVHDPIPHPYIDRLFVGAQVGYSPGFFRFSKRKPIVSA
jgi:hypothetical protein